MCQLFYHINIFLIKLIKLFVKPFFLTNSDRNKLPLLLVLRSSKFWFAFKWFVLVLNTYTFDLSVLKKPLKINVFFQKVSIFHQTRTISSTSTAWLIMVVYDLVITHHSWITQTITFKGHHISEERVNFHTQQEKVQ